MHRIKTEDLAFTGTINTRSIAVDIIKAYAELCTEANLPDAVSKYENPEDLLALRTDLSDALWYPFLEHRGTVEQNRRFIGKNIRFLIPSGSSAGKEGYAPNHPDYITDTQILPRVLPQGDMEFYNANLGTAYVDKIFKMATDYIGTFSDVYDTAAAVKAANPVMALWITMCVPYTKSYHVFRAYVTAKSVEEFIGSLHYWNESLRGISPHGLVGGVKMNRLINGNMGVDGMLYQIIMMRDFVTNVDAVVIGQNTNLFQRGYAVSIDRSKLTSEFTNPLCLTTDIAKAFDTKITTEPIDMKVLVEMGRISGLEIETAIDNQNALIDKCDSLGIERSMDLYDESGTINISSIKKIEAPLPSVVSIDGVSDDDLPVKTPTSSGGKKT